MKRKEIRFCGGHTNIYNSYVICGQVQSTLSAFHDNPLSHFLNRHQSKHKSKFL